MRESIWKRHQHCQKHVGSTERRIVVQTWCGGVEIIVFQMPRDTASMHLQVGVERQILDAVVCSGRDMHVLLVLLRGSC